MTKFLRTIRFDDSDARVFDTAAESGEWAVSGAFAFGALEPQAMLGKLQNAFSSGFLGVSTFGRSTFAIVHTAERAEIAEIERRLAEHLVARFGAPSLQAAYPLADDEIAFVLDLCRDANVGTVFAVHRFHNESGHIKEQFHIVNPSTMANQHARIWTVDEP